MINYVTADGLDTPRVVTSPAGSVIWSWSIKGNPFGDKVPSALSGYAYNLRFPGQYYDAETGLYYNVQRYYAPGSGRYRQADPVGFAGGQWSLYGYVNGNPLSYADPYGLWQVTITATISPFLIGPSGTLTFGYNHGQFNIGGWLGVGAGDSIAVNPDDLPCQKPGSLRSTRADGRIGRGALGANFSTQYGPQGNSTEFTAGVPLVKPLGAGFSVENGQISTAPVTNIVFGASAFLGTGAQWYF